MRRFLVGTDWWTDCDDAVAMRILARAVKEKEIELAGIGINACMEYSAASLIGFLKSEGVTDIPVGIDREATDFGGDPTYQKRLAENYAPQIKNDDLENAADLYIRKLKESDGKLEIIEIGYPQVLSQVLMREPRLFKEKVEKVWMMAGKWDILPGRENNFARNERSRKAAHYFCAHCPVPITFLGWEISNNILTGDCLGADDPLYQALCDHGSPHGRSSWDPMLMLLALTGDEAAAGYAAVRGKANVDGETGENDFTPLADGPHRYVKKLYPDDYYRTLVNSKIQTQ